MGARKVHFSNFLVLMMVLSFSVFTAFLSAGPIAKKSKGDGKNRFLFNDF